MLIDPGIPLEEAVTLITGITEHMLAGRSTWDDVREKVADFIGSDTIIVGHNVLFDIAMLETHGINLRDHAICDTFELSEMFSLDAESLNLGYLADFYDIKRRGPEHRALTDTWVSVDIFLHYLEHISTLEGNARYIWNLAKQHAPHDFSFFDTFLAKKDEPQSSTWAAWKTSLLTQGFTQKTKKPKRVS